MPILDQQIRSQISDLSEACGKYWELRGIAKESRKEMQLELEQHCIQAAMDGKPPKRVVGPNPVAFAEAWAREMHPRALRGGVLILPGLVYALCVLSTTSLVEPLLVHTATFTLTLFTAYLLGSLGIASLLLPLAGFLAVHIRTRIGRIMLQATVLVLGALVARSLGIRVNWSMTIFSWSWPLTILLVALAAGLFCLEMWWRVWQDPKSSGLRISIGRSLLILVGNVVLLDLFLGVSSVIVLNTCTLACKI